MSNSRPPQPLHQAGRQSRDWLLAQIVSGNINSGERALLITQRPPFRSSRREAGVPLPGAREGGGRAAGRSLSPTKKARNQRPTMASFPLSRSARPSPMQHDRLPLGQRPAPSPAGKLIS